MPCPATSRVTAGDDVVEQQRVDVVQFGAGHAVGRHRVGRHALGEVGLEHRDALREQRPQQVLEPGGGGGVGEVDDAAGRVGAVPDVGDVGGAVRPAQEVAGLAPRRRRPGCRWLRYGLIHRQTRKPCSASSASMAVRVGEVASRPSAGPTSARRPASSSPGAARRRGCRGSRILPGPVQHLLLAVHEEARRDPGAERPLGRQQRPAGERVVAVAAPRPGSGRRARSSR